MLPKGPSRVDSIADSGEAPTRQATCTAADFKLICQAVVNGLPSLVLGEAGVFPDLPVKLVEFFREDYNCAIAVYKGSSKRFFQSVAQQLTIPTSEPRYNSKGQPTGERDLTVDELKDEIIGNTGDQTLLVMPQAKRLPTSVRYWIEDLIDQGARVVCFAAENPAKDIYLDMTEIELELPSDRDIRDVMQDEAQSLGIELTKADMADLQSMAGRNTMLARKAVRTKHLGIKKARPQHTQYVTIMPVVIALLMGFGVMRFVGMGTQNRSLYIFGGVALITAMSFKQLGQVKGARKRLGA